MLLRNADVLLYKTNDLCFIAGKENGCALQYIEEICNSTI